MQIKDVRLGAMNKEYSWLKAAEILGMTPRGMRYLRKRMENFNGRHFYQTVRREHGVKLSYHCVRQMLQGAGLLKKRRARQPPAPCAPTASRNRERMGP